MNFLSKHFSVFPYCVWGWAVLNLYRFWNCCCNVYSLSSVFIAPYKLPSLLHLQVPHLLGAYSPKTPNRLTCYRAKPPNLSRKPPSRARGYNGNVARSPTVSKIPNPAGRSGPGHANIDQKTHSAPTPNGRKRNSSGLHSKEKKGTLQPFAPATPQNANKSLT